MKEKDGRQRERLQFLYLLKSKKIKSVQQATKILGRHRNTISEWIKKYQEGGLLCLTDRTSPPGRESQIRGEVFEKLKEKLSDPIGFGFYKDIQKWLKEEFNLDIHYQSIFKICHYKLGASPKVVRPVNPKQDLEKVEEFKKKHFMTKSRKKKKIIKDTKVSRSTSKTKAV